MQSVALRGKTSILLAPHAAICSLGLVIGLGWGPGLVSLVTSAATGVALYGTSRWRAAGVISALLAGIFLAYSLVGVFSIASFYLLAALLLVAGTFVTPDNQTPPRAAATLSDAPSPI